MPTHSMGRAEFRGASLEEYDDRYLDCRGGQHVYPPTRHYDVSYRGGTIIEYQRTRVCTQCGRERTDYFDKDMETLRPSTSRYPDGYLKAPGGEDITPAAARMEQVRRHGAGRRSKLRSV